jgi:hypothetical protein
MTAPAEMTAPTTIATEHPYSNGYSAPSGYPAGAAYPAPNGYQGQNHRGCPPDRRSGVRMISSAKLPPPADVDIRAADSPLT